MAQLRKDPFSGGWVIIAEGRSKRPSDFKVLPEEKPERECPFCPGREAQTPPETFALRPRGTANGPGWQVRVVPNMFPAVLPPDQPLAAQDGLFTRMNALGLHEVIIEGPEHEGRLVDAPPAQLDRIVQTYVVRLQALLAKPGVTYVQLFKNQGSQAGASLYHPHTQLLALPRVPPAVQAELDTASAHFHRTGRCPFCEVLATELQAGERLIEADDDFVLYAPFASRVPFELRLLPRAHTHDFTLLSAGQQRALARALQRAFQRLEGMVPNAPYNVVLHTAPRPEHDPGNVAAVAYHWHLEVLPRLTILGGFEWGSGVFINPLAPEAVASGLRRVALPAPTPRA